MWKHVHWKREPLNRLSLSPRPCCFPWSFQRGKACYALLSLEYICRDVWASISHTQWNLKVSILLPTWQCAHAISVLDLPHCCTEHAVVCLAVGLLWCACEGFWWVFDHSNLCHWLAWCQCHWQCVVLHGSENIFSLVSMSKGSLYQCPMTSCHPSMWHAEGQLSIFDKCTKCFRFSQESCNMEHYLQKPKIMGSQTNQLAVSFGHVSHHWKCKLMSGETNHVAISSFLNSFWCFGHSAFASPCSKVFLCPAFLCKKCDKTGRYQTSDIYHWSGSWNTWQTWYWNYLSWGSQIRHEVSVNSFFLQDCCYFLISALKSQQAEKLPPAFLLMKHDWSILPMGRTLLSSRAWGWWWL